ncbi:MAG: hypothetical protein H0U77_02565 [Nocardioidaceae bacterium]|nr:hypothetical protein [Nocardioidaceae bacterium]
MQRVSDEGEVGQLGLDLGQLRRCTGLKTSSPAGTVAVLAGLQQVRDFLQPEAEPLCGFDHPQDGDGLWRVEPVPAERALRLD